MRSCGFWGFPCSQIKHRPQLVRISGHDLISHPVQHGCCSMEEKKRRWKTVFTKSNFGGFLPNSMTERERYTRGMKRLKGPAKSCLFPGRDRWLSIREDHIFRQSSSVPLITPLVVISLNIQGSATLRDLFVCSKLQISTCLLLCAAHHLNVSHTGWIWREPMWCSSDACSSLSSPTGGASLKPIGFYVSLNPREINFKNNCSWKIWFQTSISIKNV